VSPSDRALDDAPAATADPELDYFKRRYGGMLREALEAVLSRLPDDQRSVLRLHFVDGLTVRAIGKLYRVNASTITRWIAQARAHIMDETRARLRKQLVVDDRELDSILALVESRIDLTLSRVLAIASE
jgi:RNA polymerase sigma-70 factor (ECF subfamily)